MTARLSDELTEKLRQAARRRGQSMNSFLTEAVEEHLAREAHTTRVRKFGSEEIEHWQELLKRLADK